MAQRQCSEGAFAHPPSFGTELELEILRDRLLRRTDDRPSCLLVNLAGRGLEAVAPRLGWRCASVDTAELAALCLDQQRFHFVVVNVQGDESVRSACRRFVASHALSSASLVAVFGETASDSDSDCDADGNSNADCNCDGDCDEVWARQLGVWFYSSGMPDADGFGWLCEEAVTLACAS